MPELPEVETVVRGLKRLEGAKIRGLDIFDSKVWFESEWPAEEFPGRAITRVSRRGKYIVLECDQGALIVHLRMTGKVLRADSERIPPPIREAMGVNKQIRFRLYLDRETIVFYDTRRFGTLTAVNSLASFWEKKQQAPDSLEDEAAAKPHFFASLKATKRPVKALLLDQTAIAGVGNIYADEALYKSRLHPLKPAARIKGAAAEALFRHIQSVFRASIARGGTTVNDYADHEGNAGTFAASLAVYGREDKNCKRCKKSKIKRIVVVGRSTHFCPNCQAK